MTEDKKFALRSVIERNLNAISICCELNGFRIYSPISWRKHYQLVKAAGIFARWLQKLAFYSSVNFEGFDEEAFWQEYELLCKRFPDFIMVRQFYEQNLQRITNEEA